MRASHGVLRGRELGQVDGRRDDEDAIRPDAVVALEVGDHGRRIHVDPAQRAASERAALDDPAGRVARATKVAGDEVRAAGALQHRLAARDPRQVKHVAGPRAWVAGVNDVESTAVYQPRCSKSERRELAGGEADAVTEMADRDVVERARRRKRAVGAGADREHVHVVAS
jgi:hypothetical protein